MPASEEMNIEELSKYFDLLARFDHEDKQKEFALEACSATKTEQAPDAN